MALEHEIAKYDALFKKGNYNLNPNHKRFDVAERFFTKTGATTVLDVGVGKGHFLRRMQNLGIEVYGVEPSSEARRLLPDIVVNGYSHAIPFADRSFDVVCCLDVLEHVPREYVLASLEEISRVSKKYAIVSVADHSDIVEGVELHISAMSFTEWKTYLQRYFNIIDSDIVASTADPKKTSCVYLLVTKNFKSPSIMTR